MAEDLRKYPRSPSNGHLRIWTTSNVPYTVSLRNISLGGAYVRTINLPRRDERVWFEILDEYGLCLSSGQGQVVWVATAEHAMGMGFGIQFDEELDQAMLDFLRVSQEDDFF